MNFAKRDRSIVDFLFILTLFAVFMVSALFIVLFGAKSYKNTVADMDSNFSTRTAHAYITEKIRAHDCTEGAGIADISAESENGFSTLTLKSEAGGRNYITYMYVDGGYLKEYTAPEDIPFDEKSGVDVLPVEEFEVTRVNDALFAFHVKDDKGAQTDFYVTLYSDTDGREAERHE